MIPCPVCQKGLEIEERNFGAISSCPFCRAVFYVGWDGTPELGHHEPEPPTAEPSASWNEQALQEPAEPSFEPSLDSAGVIDSVSLSESPPETVSEASQEFVSQDGFVTTEPTEEPAEPGPATDFSDVTSYANADTIAVGPISYIVFVRGLELSETFEKLREALTDSRFGWDVEEVMTGVRAGELMLRGLNPTKASILVSRLKYLPVELEWKQEVFSASP